MDEEEKKPREGLATMGEVGTKKGAKGHLLGLKNPNTLPEISKLKCVHPQMFFFWLGTSVIAAATVSAAVTLVAKISQGIKI